MDQFKFEMPKTYEEALERKKEILDILNEYNEDLLLGNPTEVTEEEVENLREEFEILDDHYLTKEEKKQYDVLQANPKRMVGWTLFFIYAAFIAFINFPLIFPHIGVLLIKITDKIFGKEFKLITYVILIGLIGILSCLVSYIIYRKVKNKEDKKILFYFLIGHLAYFVIGFVIFLLLLYRVI
ncbi:MAG: hypothetical protein ACOX40_02960 [Bacilli bacterium]|jgi:hypothetical protein